MVSHLPYEILYHILSHSPTRATALTCALVNKAWLPACRGFTCSIATQVIKENDSSTDAFLEVFIHPLSTLPTYITRISLFLTSKVPLDYDSVCSALMAGRHGFLELRFCRGTDQWDGGPDDSLLHNLLRHSHLTLRRAAFTNGSPEDVPGWLDALSSAPFLEDIILLPEFTDCNRTMFLASSASPPPSLRHIHVNFCNPAFMKKWVFNAPNLEHFHIEADNTIMSQLENALVSHHAHDVGTGSWTLGVSTSYSPYQREHTARFLDVPHCSSLLVSMEIRLPLMPFCDLDRIPKDLDLGSAMNLQFLKLKFSVDVAAGTLRGATEKDVLSSIHHLLSTAPVPSQMTVDLTLRITVSHLPRRPQQMMLATRSRGEYGFTDLDKALSSFVEEVGHFKAVTLMILKDPVYLRAERFTVCKANARPDVTITVDDEASEARRH